MILIVCVDDNLGMMFNRRRQSKDEKVREDMMKCLPDGKKLLVSPYTAKQFEETFKERLHISEQLEAEAEDGMYCFVEDANSSAFAAGAEGLILYRWNRSYPADRYFTLDLTNYELVSTAEIVGKSHPEILKEVYKRK